MKAIEVIDKLSLAEHPEGGWYRETWRDPATTTQRGHGTAILYLLQQGERSHWHRVDAVEIWHYHGGDGFALVTWSPGQAPRVTQLGCDIAAGQQPQLVIPAGVWQAASHAPGPCGWSLAGRTVSPAFDFKGFELAPPLWQPAESYHAQAEIPSVFRTVAVDHDVDLPWPASAHLATADVHVTWLWRAATQQVQGTVIFGSNSEGLPGHVHGGLLSALCDEAMGWTCWLHGFCAPGARVSVDYLRPFRPGDSAEFSVELKAQAGRVLHLCATLHRGGMVHARATGRYIAVKPKDWTPFATWPGLQRWDALRAAPPGGRPADLRPDGPPDLAKA